MISRQIKAAGLGVALLVGLGVQSRAAAGESDWRPGNRIAISVDGNPDADLDDIGATPMTLAILAKAGLQAELVHYDFNNWLEYKRIDPEKNEMWRGAMGAQARWGFGGDKFFDASIRPEAAIANLTAEINRSTSSDPLYLIVGGPMELIYQAAVRADNDSLAHVRLISHSGYNDYFRPRLWQHNLDDVLALNASIRVHRLPDQNANLKTTPDYGPWAWLRDHPDASLAWVYERMRAGRADVSDAGMVSWLIGQSDGRDRTTIAALEAFFGAEPIRPPSGFPQETASPPSGVDPVIYLPGTDSVFEEVDGKVVIEAESVPTTGDWVVEQSERGYTGDGYLRYLPKNINVIHSPARGVLTYKLRISTPGRYRMALKHSHRGAPARDKWNDAWTLMGIDPHPFGSIRKTYHAISEDQFHGDTGFTFQTTHDNYGTVAKRDGHFSKPIYELSAGEHYFFVVGRSGGYRLDKIHFFREGVEGFTDDAIPSTPVAVGDSHSAP